jgi:hypothetical protein
MQIRVKHFCERSLAFSHHQNKSSVKTREQELFPSAGARYLGSASRDVILTVRCSGVVSAGPAARLSLRSAIFHLAFAIGGDAPVAAGEA